MTESHRKLHYDDIFHKIENMFFKSGELNRLRDISFLGGLEYDENLRKSDFSAGSRLDHTRSVAQLTKTFCQIRNYDLRDTSICISYAFLHDIGHTVFSHSGESYLKSTFEVDHNGMLIIMISNDNSFNSIFNELNIEKNYLIKCISESGFNRNFDSTFRISLNPDTLDGIYRTAIKFNEPIDYNIYSNVIEFSANPHPEMMYYGDYFWKLKSKIYKKYINSYRGVKRDLFINKILSSSNACIDDLYGSDSEFIRKYNDAILSMDHKLHNALSEFMAQKPREFFVDENVAVHTISDINLRYKTGW